MHVVLDANVYLDAVSHLSGTAELPEAVRRPDAPLALKLIVGLAAGWAPTVTPHSGSHIWGCVVRTLTRRYGWSPADAQRWVALCAEMIRSRGGSADLAADVTVRESQTMALRYGLELDQARFCEDAHVVAIARRARAAIVTADRAFQAASIPDVEVLAIAEFAARAAAEHAPVGV